MKTTTWHERTTTKKGDIGERLVYNFLVGMGFIPYIIPEEFNNDVRHVIDGMWWKFEKDSLGFGYYQLYFVEVKTKPRRIWHPDTGIDTRRLWDYNDLIERYPNIKVLIIFVDSTMKMAYGNYLTELMKMSHKENNGKYTYFNLKVMKKFFNISDEDCKQIVEYSTMNEKYKIMNNE